MRLELSFPAILLAILPVACSSSSIEAVPTTTTAAHFAVHGAPTDGPGVLVEVDQADFDLHNGTGISDIVVSDNYLYMAVPWSGIYRMPKLGGVVTVVDEEPNAVFNHLAINRQYVFWDKVGFDGQDSPATLIRRQANANGSISTVLEGAFSIPSSNIPPPNLQATSNDVFLVYNPSRSEIGSVVSFPTSGGTVSAPIFSWTLGAVSDPWPNWAVDDLGLFMTSGAGGGPTSETGCRLWTFEGAAFARRELAPCPERLSQLAWLDSESLYFTSAHSIWKMPRAGGQAVAIATSDASQYVGWDMVVDSSNAYFRLGGEVVWVPKSGGTIRKLIDRTDLPGGASVMVQDARYLYLLCDYRQVVVVPKPTLH